MSHEKIEKNTGLMAILIIVAVSFGGLAEIVPLFFITDTTEAVDGLEPYPALQLEGRDIYIREGCNTCHTQMVRPMRAETERYGHYTVAGARAPLLHVRLQLRIKVEESRFDAWTQAAQLSLHIVQRICTAKALPDAFCAGNHHVPVPVAKQDLVLAKSIGSAMGSGVQVLFSFERCHHLLVEGIQWQLSEALPVPGEVMVKAEVQEDARIPS